MERVILVNCAILCVVIILFGVVSSDPHYDTQVSTRNEKNEDRKQPYLWFGPRLGRKKRNPNGDDIYHNNELKSEQLAALMHVIQNYPWAIVAVNEGKRYTDVDFTPRLGRDSGEEFISGNSGDRWLQDQDLSGEFLTQRSQFIPRMGRRLSLYSPRLGRDNDKHQFL